LCSVEAGPKTAEHTMQRLKCGGWMLMAMMVHGCAGKDVALGAAENLDPITAEAVRLFDETSRVDVNVVSHASEGALRLLCTGYADVAAANRPISADEQALCKGHNVKFVELPLAWDALVVVVHHENPLGH